MSVSGFLERVDRLAGRFNRWFAGAAVATSVEHSGTAGGPPVVDPTAVVTALGEIERERPPGAGADD